MAEFRQLTSTNYIIHVTPLSTSPGEGIIVLDIEDGAATDAAHNPSVAARTTVGIDLTAPYLVAVTTDNDDDDGDATVSYDVLSHLCSHLHSRSRLCTCVWLVKLPLNGTLAATRYAYPPCKQTSCKTNKSKIKNQQNKKTRKPKQKRLRRRSRSRCNSPRQ